MQDSCVIITFEVDPLAVQLMFGHAGRRINVAGVLEEMVRLHLDEVRRHVPYIFAIVDDAHHGIAAREQRPAKLQNKISNLKY